jgi:hypothetical protein
LNSLRTSQIEPSHTSLGLQRLPTQIETRSHYYDRIFCSTSKLKNTKRKQTELYKQWQTNYRQTEQYRQQQKAYQQTEGYKKALENNKTKIICECGLTINKGDITTHRKRKKHIDLINAKI